MRTNIEKYKHWTGVRDEQARKAVVAALGHAPDEIWKLGGRGNDFEAEAWAVTSIGARRPKGQWNGWGNPTNVQVELAKADCEAPLAPEQIFLTIANLNVTAAVPLSKHAESWHLNASDWDAEVARLREHYTLKEDQFSCAQCGKATDNAEKVTSAVIAQQYPGRRREFDYCSGRCAGHHQMAHEG